MTIVQINISRYTSQLLFQIHVLNTKKKSTKILQLIPAYEKSQNHKSIDKLTNLHKENK